MLRITKKFHFETAHAIHGYPGSCRHIHGHSYELHVTVRSVKAGGNEWLPGPGMLVDFRELKAAVEPLLKEVFDHRLILSRDYLQENPLPNDLFNLVIWDYEPTAENMLVYLGERLRSVLPPFIKLNRMLLYETRDSYAEWELEE